MLGINKLILKVGDRMSRFHEKDNIYVSQITLKVTNLETSLEFYKEIIGFKLLEGSKNKAILTVDGVNPIITLIKPEKVIPKLRKRTGLYHIAILLPNRVELGALLKNIRDKEYSIIGGSNHGVSEAIYLQDPDDNGIEVYADTPEEDWDIDDGNINMITDYLDYKGLIKAAEDMAWTGLSNDTIIGHIHLHVADLDDSQRFYEALGFKITQSIPNQAYFMSTGGYHHHIGFNIWNGKGAKPLDNESAGMEYFTLLYPNKDLLDKSLKMLDEQGYKYYQIDGSLFANDPSENLINLEHK